MLYRITAIKDSASQQWAAPMFLPNTQQAVRAFMMEVNRQDNNNALFHHPEDFEMYYLGTYDSETATLTPEPMQIIARGKDLVRLSNNRMEP